MSSACSVVIREARWIIGDGPELHDGQGPSTLFVFAEAVGDCPQGVNGWHAKEFPAGHNLTAAAVEAATDSAFVSWPRVAPPVGAECWRVGGQRPGTDRIVHVDVHDARQAVEVMDAIEKVDGAGSAWPEKLVGQDWAIQDSALLRARFGPAVKADAAMEIEGVTATIEGTVSDGPSAEQLAARAELRRRFMLKFSKCYAAHATWRTDATMRNLFAIDLIFAATELINNERPGSAAAVRRAFEVIFPDAEVPPVLDLIALADDPEADRGRMIADALGAMRTAFFDALTEQGVSADNLDEGLIYIPGGVTPGTAGTEFSLDAVLSAVLDAIAPLSPRRPVQGV